MRIITAVIMVSTLAVSSLSRAAEVGSGDDCHPSEELTQRSTQNHTFGGISLTEHQCQQMRDLMQRARYEQPPANVSELRTIHCLIIAENSGENAARAQAEEMANEQIACQVEMVRVHNQMCRLLTLEQQAILNEKHQQRMGQLRDVTQ